MTPEKIIPDFLASVPKELRFRAINRFLSLRVTRNIDTLSQAEIEKLFFQIRPVDQLSVEAIALLEKRLFEIYDITQP